MYVCVAIAVTRVGKYANEAKQLIELRHASLAAEERAMRHFDRHPDTQFNTSGEPLRIGRMQVARGCLGQWIRSIVKSSPLSR